MKSLNTENPALQWAAVIVDELLRSGISRVVIAPGSRSTPLAIAFAANPGIERFSLIDERGAAYFALGLGLESGTPAALLCTSGTAAANFFPAVVEAYQAQVPLVVLTADRPAELRGTGANQTINQVGLFGQYVRYAQDLLAPISFAQEWPARYLRTSINRAVFGAQYPVPGPVHLNLPFRKPLEPQPGQALPSGTYAAREANAPYTNIQPARPQTTIPEIKWPARGLIVAGPRCPEDDFPQAVAELSKVTGYPVLADALSGLRFGSTSKGGHVLNPQVSQAMTAGDVPMPQLVIQFGGVPVSKSAMTLLERLPIEVPRISVQSSGTWHDDVHGLSHLLHAAPADFCRKLAEVFPAAKRDPNWFRMLQRVESAYWEAVSDIAAEKSFEGLALKDVLAALDEDSLLFVANSLSVRHLDEFTEPSGKRVRVFCNRGASGIDGTVSTALGIAASAGKKITIVLGDLALYHDLNGLLALERCGLSATIVLLNNDGGGIFRRLPVAAHEPPFTELFLTPHGLDFGPGAAMFGVNFLRTQDRAQFRTMLEDVIHGSETHLVEFQTNSAEHEQARLRIVNTFREKIKEYTSHNRGPN